MIKRLISILFFTLWSAGCGHGISEIVVQDVTPRVSRETMGPIAAWTSCAAAISQNPAELGDHLVHLGLGQEDPQPAWVEWGLRLQPSPLAGGQTCFPGSSSRNPRPSERTILWLGRAPDEMEGEEVLPLPPSIAPLNQQQFAALLALALNRPIGLKANSTAASYFGSTPTLTTLYGGPLPGAPSPQALDSLKVMEEHVSSRRSWLALAALNHSRYKPAPSPEWRAFLDELETTLSELERGIPMTLWSSNSRGKTPGLPCRVHFAWTMGSTGCNWRPG